MIHKLLGVLLAAGLAISVASSASAGTFDPANSYLGFKLGNIPRIDLPAAQSGVVTLTGTFGDHQIHEFASIFQTTNRWINSAAFTGFPQITGLKISMHTGSGSFADGFSVPNSVGPGNISGFGGYEAVTGTALLVAGGFNVPIDLSVLGSGGTNVISPVLNNAVVIEGEPFGTDPMVMTGLSSNLLVVPGRGVTGVAFTLNLTTVEVITAIEVTLNGLVVENNTVTLTGTNMLQSASEAGMVTMVSPYRVSTGNLAGRVAGAVYKKFTFVPEPGTMLLLVSGAVGLAVIGRKRMRK
jgi:hypothetical protein